MSSGQRDGQRGWTNRLSSNEDGRGRDIGAVDVVGGGGGGGGGSDAKMWGWWGWSGHDGVARVLRVQRSRERRRCLFRGHADTQTRNTDTGAVVGRRWPAVNDSRAVVGLSRLSSNRPRHPPTIHPSTTANHYHRNHNHHPQCRRRGSPASMASPNTLPSSKRARTLSSAQLFPLNSSTVMVRRM